MLKEKKKKVRKEKKEGWGKGERKGGREGGKKKEEKLGMVHEFIYLEVHFIKTSHKLPGSDLFLSFILLYVTRTHLIARWLIVQAYIFAMSRPK